MERDKMERSFRFTGFIAAKAGVAAVFTPVIFVFAGPALWFIATAALYKAGAGRIAELLGGIISAATCFIAAYLFVAITVRRYMKLSG